MKSVFFYNSRKETEATKWDAKVDAKSFQFEVPKASNKKVQKNTPKMMLFGPWESQRLIVAAGGESL